jgi:hypothetical protein
MIIVVFVVAILKQNVFLVLFLLCIEIIAGAWYSISFIPFGRKIVLSFLRATGVCFPCFYVSDNVQECYAKNVKSSNSGSTFGGSSNNNSNPIFGGNSKSSSSSSGGFFGGGKK